MSRLPTGKQMRLLFVFGGGAMLVSGATREIRALVARGWLLSACPEAHPDNLLRITPAGLHALADAVERYGLPSFEPEAERRAA